MNSMREILYRESIVEAFEEEMAQSGEVIVLGENISDSRKSLLESVKKKFPERVINNLPLIEDMLIGIGLGMSIGGLKPVLSLNYDTHLLLALDDLYKLGIWRYRMAEEHTQSVIVRLAHSRGSGGEFSASFLSFILHIPEIILAVPSTPYFAKGLLKSAFRSGKQVVFWEHKSLYNMKGQVPVQEYEVPFGTSFAVEGQDVTLVSWSYMSVLAERARKRLVKEGISVEHLILQTLHPLDYESLFASAKKTRKIVIVEEEMIRGGVGAEIVARIAESILGCHIRRVGARNTAIPQTNHFQDLILPTEEDIMRACREVFGKPQKLFFLDFPEKQMQFFKKIFRYKRI